MQSQNIQRPSSCTKKVVKDHYEFLGVIGHGGFSQIKLAQHHLTGEKVAVKVVCKNEKNMGVLSEPDIMRSLDHPNIIQLFQIIETQRNIYIIMEYADGGKLLHHIPPGGMQEEKARRFFKQVVSAVDYCHDKGIVHRDLKPENVMVDARGNIKLIDFGLSTWFTSGQNLRHFWGTLSHLAPEVVMRQAHEGPQVDIWSLGVMLYFLLTGTRPFVGRTAQDLLREIVLGTFNIPHRVPVKARQLIHQILTLNPRERPTAKQILQHPWLTQGKQYVPQHFTESLTKPLDPEIMTILCDLGYDPYKTWVSLATRKFNTAMATYLILKHQKSQGPGCMFQGKPVPPRVKPHPCPMDLSHFTGITKRSPSEPVLPTFPMPQLPEEAKQAGKKAMRRASLPALHLHFLTTRTTVPDVPTQSDSGQQHAKRKNWKRVVRGIVSCVRKLCCCIPCVSNKVALM
ncbi:sperm motility kinase 2B [Ictidomys tridecemlineatus]|uniref:sperm motility kinase 2B-like n=1 Tax=Ictidomys tridecemlineatus TaxID=43179 RepID=UPI00038BD4B3|nr:sperm motility kinase 2B-like [Ictidomys tridecemlineatus]KAG3292918.1 sperm motility kinase 2B-like [Ictidomys tridecemlineatus]